MTMIPFDAAQVVLPLTLRSNAYRTLEEHILSPIATSSSAATAIIEAERSRRQFTGNVVLIVMSDFELFDDADARVLERIEAFGKGALTVAVGEQLGPLPNTTVCHVTAEAAPMAIAEAVIDIARSFGRTPRTPNKSS